MNRDMNVILNQPNSIGPQEMFKGMNNGSGIHPVSSLPDPIRSSTSGMGSRMQNHLLQPLINAERVLIKQKRELIEIALGCETENRYEIYDEQNQLIYIANESSEFCMRCICGPLRPIVVDIRDPDGNPVIFLDRPLGCQEICFPCCLQSITVQSPPGIQSGKIIQKWGLKPELHVKDESNNLVFVVKGPLCQFSCRCGDVDFGVFASDGKSECGKISKRWSGMLQETFTDADIFGVKFPPRINPQMKVLLIAATFLIDYMYFEQSQQ